MPSTSATVQGKALLRAGRSPACSTWATPSHPVHTFALLQCLARFVSALALHPTLGSLGKMREMKGAIKQIKKVTHKVEAAALGLHQNVKHVAENFITPAPTKDFAEPPEIIGGVAYANPARNSRRTPGTNSPLRSDALRIPQGVDWSAQELVEARAASGLCSETHGGSAWWTGPGQDLYLCVAVREARNLPNVDYDRRSTSP